MGCQTMQNEVGLLSVFWDGASKIGHNMETIQVYQDKMEQEQNGYAASGVSGTTSN